MKNISSLLKKDWPILILIVLGFVIGIYFYPTLPNRIPIHWNTQGQVNGYGSKLFGTFGIPVIILALYIMFVALPFIDPKRNNYRAFEPTYQFLKYLLVVFFLGMELISLLIASGSVMNKPLLIQVMVSLLFILLGNVMGRFKHNYFVGIRTPWTLANEEVWRKTHRLAAPLWVCGGIVNILLAVLGMTFNGRGLIFVLAVICLVPIGYSYLAYRELGIHNDH
ncbi:putative integral membrane protein [Desulfosporosinus acidiphilus SJ4]|uniref:Putative integral membrane protein n=1 Tax=Desulfosporosinus acidiphilus (strain DSM 22704 / JCM 16185 / SJ4) TaxID=646529 RepID=I4D2N7_DESAJ|nr:SdpI family protein [Desulfosporosinus acidiphilus]AFM40061.1 putative integral membrane protein [Desulfosporosinus acidiphilus SJ4]